MANELVFYTNPMSRGRVARWMLEEVGAPYRTEIIEYGEQMKSPPYTDINPMGKVPAIKHGETVVTENAAICAYLADAFPASGLAPAPGSPLRGPYYRWLFFGAGPLEAAWTNDALGVVVPPDKTRMVGYGTFDDVLNTLEGTLKQAPYLAGDFSAADLYIGSQLGFGMRFGRIPSRPVFEEYAQRLMGRPAAKQAAEKDGPVPAPSRAAS